MTRTTTDIETKLMRAGHVMRMLDISRRTLNLLEHTKLIRTIILASQKRYLKEDVIRLLDPDDGPGAELWTPAEAANFMGGVSARTVVRMMDSGTFRSVKTPHGHRRVYAVEVRKFVLKSQGEGHASSESKSGRSRADR